ncbi:putative centromere microtubule-binding protein cbf5 protein [Neofusicoccum parvum UCRNP2]|uniref:Derlin n=1 Tax=Botryosphaeria parva (strain UCR-NP2) TaxID=1287680 RepID=R1GHD8_BOTPV|nr:putative centromere microtubule-binding protein cbf5 protein [Neofusicoccum parvum UCRNP2]
MDVIRSWPPVTRTLVVGSLLLSIGVYSGILSFMPFVYIPQRVFALLPQIWRPVTAFFITGPQMGIIFDPYFLYQYGSQLERDSARFSEAGSFFVYVVFNGLVIVALAGHLLGAYLFLNPLIMAITYTFAQDNANRMVTFFVIQIQAKYLPYLLLLVTFVMGGTGAALIQGTGLLSSHLYDHLTRIWPTFGGGRNLITTPRIVKEFFGGGGVRPAPQARGYGVAFGAPGEARTTGTNWAAARGPGRRLGGE